MDAHVSDSLRKAVRLRAEIEGLEGAGAERRGLVRRLHRIYVGTGVVVMLTLLGIGSYIVYGGTHPDPAPTSPSYTSLRIVNDAGRFAGHVSIANPFDRDLQLFVTVDLYDGEQHVGEVSGDVMLKPDSASMVDLTGVDDYVAFTESRVHLLGWPNHAVGSQGGAAT